MGRDERPGLERDTRETRGLSRKLSPAPAAHSKRCSHFNAAFLSVSATDKAVECTYTNSLPTTERPLLLSTFTGV